MQLYIIPSIPGHLNWNLTCNILAIIISQKHNKTMSSIFHTPYHICLKTVVKYDTKQATWANYFADINRRFALSTVAIENRKAMFTYRKAFSLPTIMAPRT